MNVTLHYDKETKQYVRYASAAGEPPVTWYVKKELLAKPYPATVTAQLIVEIG